MYIRYYTSSLIFFAYWDRRPKRPNINLLPIIFLSFLLTGKVADNQIKLLKSEISIGKN
jgi:hypothetical protein